MSLASRNYQEKRDFIRMQIDSPVSLTLDDGRTLSGVCRDLSGGGMLVEVNAAVPIGTRAQVSLISPHGHSPSLEASAEVARVDGHPGDQQTCTLGLHISEMLA